LTEPEKMEGRKKKRGKGPSSETQRKKPTWCNGLGVGETQGIYILCKGEKGIKLWKGEGKEEKRRASPAWKKGFCRGQFGEKKGGNPEKVSEEGKKKT